jgi:acetate CoA/acetoacetate CoA-transferase alpha subunit
LKGCTVDHEWFIPDLYFWRGGSWLVVICSMTTFLRWSLLEKAEQFCDGESIVVVFFADGPMTGQNRLHKPQVNEWSAMRKITTVENAVAMIPNGAVLMIGGFMGVGTPIRLIDEIIRQRKADLTIIANDTARPKVGIGRLVSAKLVKKIIVSHIGTNPETQRQMIAGEIEVDLVPQGTLAERIRAGGVGLGGFLTATGLGTVVENGKQVIEVEGRRFLLEVPLKSDFSLVNAKRVDYWGNLEYFLTARNFNPLMAMAGAITIAEADDHVPVGVIPPDSVGTPSVLVDHIVRKA